MLLAAKYGVVEMVSRLFQHFPLVIRDSDQDKKNVVLLAAEKFIFLLIKKVESVWHELNKCRLRFWVAISNLLITRDIEWANLVFGLEQVETVEQFGVVVLIFARGLEFSLTKIDLQVELQYQHEYAGISTGIGPTANPIVNFAGVIGNEKLSLGIDLSFDTASGNITKLNAGLSYTHSNLIAALTL
ncbi:mitochondrial outer membrane protein porin 3-like [Cucumis melo]|uniref:Mitochondrial outer membrane protein porin 3-like n=1 Tax=Cucumis melo TaxID=3656 RepID=A0ABM3KJ33_CUCME|nr:mitochondrial outer membrane protein porin 3-like [Cucumis melo]